MDFLFRKGLTLVGNRDNPDERKRLFDRFGGGEKLKSLYQRMKSAIENPCLDAPDPFDVSFPDPNLVAGYFDEPSEKSEFQRRYEDACLDSEPLMAEVASVSLILQKFQNEPTRAPKSCRQRAYAADDSAPADTEPDRTERRRQQENYENFSSDFADSYSDLGSFDAVPQSVAESISVKIEEEHNEKKFKNRRADSVKAGRKEGEISKKRTRVLPFLLAAAATSLFFHFQSFTETVKRTDIEQNMISRTTDSIPDFSEAPVSEKIATPSRLDFQPAEETAPSVSAADSGWENLTLLSESEQISTENAVLLYRPFRRGIRGDIVTAIPGEQD